MKKKFPKKYTCVPKPMKILLQVMMDSVSVLAAYFGLLLVRFGAEIPARYSQLFMRQALPIVLIYLIFFNLFSLYRSFLESENIEKLMKIAGATICSASTIYFFLLMVAPDMMMPGWIYFAGGGLSMVLTGYFRLNYYVMCRLGRRVSSKVSERAMIIGAGETGGLVIRQLLETRELGVQPIIIVDDDVDKLDRRIRGIRVAGNRHDIPALVEKYQIDIIIFCMPSVSSRQKREILKICSETKCMVRTVPSLDEIMNHQQLTEFRKFEMSDLLPRPEVEIDVEGVQEYITGNCILVTGGGGSIGSELCRQLAVFRPGKLVIFDIYENTAYELQMEMQHTFPDLLVVVEIGSIRDMPRLEEVFSLHRPEIVFHAAAHKHVPLMENNPAEAVYNNVFGTLNTARTADKFGARRFVLISTDKAVHPTSVMGATKRLSEHVIQYMNSISTTQFVAVRFGNVLGSNGSVIPLFQRQIEHGGPVTVTHKDITRYFMTIPEAARLVLQAGSMAHQGEIFILNMGEPVRIDDVARTLIRLSGFQPNVDIKIEYTGLRPGEKLSEELFLDEEKTERTESGGIMVGRAHDPSPEETKRNLDWLLEQVEADADVKQCLQAVLKSYHPAPEKVKVEVAS